MRSAVIIGGARCPGDIGPAPTVAKRRDGADRTYPRGGAEISTGKAPRERRGGLACKIAKWKTGGI